MKIKKYLPSAIFFALLALFLFWRAPYGFSFDDEPYLATLPQELMHGARLYIDEWHKCQNTGILTYPVFRVLYRINGGVEGILLQMRYVYCVCWLLCLLFVSAKLRDLGNGRFFALAFIALFSPLDYMTLSYTSISLMATLAIAAVLYADILQKENTSVGSWLLLGFLFTVASLAYPYYAFIYCLFLPVFLWTKRKDRERRAVHIRNALASMVIPAVSAAVYFLWVLIRAGSLRMLYRNIVMLLRTFGSMKLPLIYTVPLMFFHHGTVPRGKLYLIGMAILLSAGFLLRKRKKIKAPLLLAAALLWLYCQLPYLKDEHIYAYYRINAPVRDIIWIGLLAFILLEKKPWKLFIAFYPLSFLYAVVSFLCSNTMVLATSMALSVGGTAAMIFVFLLARELCESSTSRKRGLTAAALAVSVMLIVQLGTEIIVRTRYQYWDDTMDKLRYTIDTGPSKGLITTEEHREEYNKEMEAIKTLLPREKLEGKTFMALNCRPTAFLAADTVNGGYSSWTQNVEDINEVLRIYYFLNDKPLPDYVLIKGNNNIPLYSGDEYTAAGYGEYTLLEKN